MVNYPEYLVLLIAVALVTVLFAGCVNQAPALATPVPTPAPVLKSLTVTVTQTSPPSGIPTPPPTTKQTTLPYDTSVYGTTTPRVSITPTIYCTPPLCQSGKFICLQENGCPGGCGMSCDTVPPKITVTPL